MTCERGRLGQNGIWVGSGIPEKAFKCTDLTQHGVLGRGAVQTGL